MMLPFFFLLVLRLSTLPRDAAALTRYHFPKGFTFGAGTSAYQVEGAAAEDGRKLSIWDTFTHQGYSPGNATADIAADQYHHYKDDVRLMHKMSLDAYRFSIAWPRLIPDGRGRINPKGLDYYNNLIDELLGHGVEPHVTLYHFDLPQSIQDKYGGFLSPRLVDDFTAYADACFNSFGDRVKNWVTMNEPNIETIAGFNKGIWPPQRCSYPFGETNCTAGDSTTEPYIAAHHLLLAHASAVSLYRPKYQAKQRGQIGITLMGAWHEPASDTPEDAAAAVRMREFQIGWFMHPLLYGHYPPIMKSRVGARLPKFTAEQSIKLSGSCDFIGLTHYKVTRTRADENAFGLKQRDFFADTAAIEVIQEGPSEYAPWALGKLLEHLKLEYGNPPVIIHENGYPDNPETPSKIEHNDDYRTEYLQDYIEVMYLSIQNESNVRGYFVWSFLDLFEVLDGYKSRYGICGVDMKSKGRTRYLRNSGHWYSSFLKGSELRPSSPSRDIYVIA